MADHHIKNILNTRSANQAHALTQKLQAHGLHVSHLPLLEIIPVQFYFDFEKKYDYVIFTSQNAVEFFCRACPDVRNSDAVIIAVGSATKDALHHTGVMNCICPAEYSSGGILALDILQNVQGKLIAIVSGENPKPLLTASLTIRNAHVDNIYCYRREPILYDMEIIFPKLKSAEIDAVVITSQENFSHLLFLFEKLDYRLWLLSKMLCVINERMETAAHELGFKHVLRAENATDDAIVRVLTSPPSSEFS